jgi:5-(carboxyamino)imidazole ribonucleotide synthase
VLALELFVSGDHLLANEIAPRVHNSGHWTIDGCNTSQFENHLRAILDLPLGDAAACGHAGMINLLGEMPGKAAVSQMGDCFLHDYGKEPRPGRKLGHVTVLADTRAARDEQLERLGKLLII